MHDAGYAVGLLATVPARSAQHDAGFGARVFPRLERYDAVAEIKFSAPNKHHFLYDLSAFKLDNPGEVFHADDRPYGLIQATVVRDDAEDAGLAWYTVPAFA